MIVTDRFVFIHLERTGGNFFSRLLLKACPGAREIGYHYPRYLLPREYRKLPVLGFVRNPWDWYVSFYHHKAMMRVRPFSRYEFKDLTQRLLFLNSIESKCIELKRKMILVCPESIEGNRGLGVMKKELRSFKARRMGFYTWLFTRMFADENGEYGDVRFGRYEAFVEDAGRLLKDHGLRINSHIKKYLHSGERLNSSRHGDYQQYFSEELQLRVQLQEKKVVNAFNYKFCGQKT